METGRDTALVRFKGMNEDDVWERDASWARYVENMERDPSGFWRTMHGAHQVAGGDWEGPGAIIGLVWFQPRPNQRFLVFEEVTGEATSQITWLRFPSLEKVSIATRQRTPGRPAASQFVQAGRWLYHFNGIEHPIRWDGTVVRRVGWASTTPRPIVAGNSQGFSHYDSVGADLQTPAVDFVQPLQRGMGTLPELDADDEPHVHAYGITIGNDLDNESPMSTLAYAAGITSNSSLSGSLASSTGTATGGQIFGLASVMVDVPVFPAEARWCRLWRSVNLRGGTTALPELFLLAEFANGGGFQFCDSTPDSELGQLYLGDLAGPVPLGIRCAAFHHDSLWVAVDGFVYRSRAGQDEVFPPLQRYSAGSGSVVSLWSVPRGLVVGTTKGIFMIKGSPDVGYRVELVTERVECVGPRAMAMVDGLGLVFITANGPMVLQGTLEDDLPTRVVPLGGIRETWSREVPRIGLFNAMVVHRPELEEVWFHLPIMGENRPSRGYVYHYGGGGSGWSVRPEWKFSAACSYAGRTWLGSWDTDAGTTCGIFVLSRAGTGLVLSSAINTPDDPSVPLTGLYTESYPEEEGGYTSFYKTISSEAIRGIYESGNFRTPTRTSPQSAELLMMLNGLTNAMDVQIRYDRRSHFEQTNDVTWRSTMHPEQSDDPSSTRARPRWNEATWSTTGMWVQLEPGFVRIPLPTEAQFEVQFRVMGLDVSVGGIRLETDPSTPNRRRESS